MDPVDPDTNPEHCYLDLINSYAVVFDTYMVTFNAKYIIKNKIKMCIWFVSLALYMVKDDGQ